MRKMSVTELSGPVNITTANISMLKNGKEKAVKLEALNNICQVLGCQPGHIRIYKISQRDLKRAL